MDENDPLSRSNERTATVAEDGRIRCPWCESTDTIYAEDTTVMHVILKVHHNAILVDAEGAPEEDAMNQRIHCEVCGTDSTLPDIHVIEFI